MGGGGGGRREGWEGYFYNNFYEIHSILNFNGNEKENSSQIYQTCELTAFIQP